MGGEDGGRGGAGLHGMCPRKLETRNTRLVRLELRLYGRGRGREGGREGRRVEGVVGRDTTKKGSEVVTRIFTYLDDEIITKRYGRQEEGRGRSGKTSGE